MEPGQSNDIDIDEFLETYLECCEQISDIDLDFEVTNWFGSFERCLI